MRRLRLLTLARGTASLPTTTEVVHRSMTRSRARDTRPPGGLKAQHLKPASPQVCQTGYVHGHAPVADLQHAAGLTRNTHATPARVIVWSILATRQVASAAPLAVGCAEPCQGLSGVFSSL